MLKTASEVEQLTRSLWDTEHWGFAVDDSSTIGAGQQGGVRDMAAPPIGVAISTAANRSAYIDFENFEGGRERAVELLKDVFNNGLLSKSVHDLKRAVALLSTLNIEIEGVTDDTLLAAYLIDPVRSRYDLGDLIRESGGGGEGWSEPEGELWSAQSWRAAGGRRFYASSGAHTARAHSGTRTGNYL
ncbi:MAG: hypothetical protein WKF84_11600 [Pyrinomonadaceae bacterium]